MSEGGKSPARLRYRRHGKWDRERATAYQDRNVLLVQMGYQNYTEYLASDAWRDIRERVRR